ncbi:D-glycero-beta-D-manno-heptose 1-phosphate adenylyltransferase [bacterium]|nr:D-glycero-beta-D-manno-heptose 1-phosphate adenylyltransferase [bacterium]
MHPSLKAKIHPTVAALKAQTDVWKNAGERVVFTNGCFDIIHPGHVDYLFHARDLGSRLVIGVNTDDSVRRLKGQHRPIQHEEARLQVLAALACVDALLLFGEETPIHLITEIMPDVLVKGGDYTIKTIVGAQEVMANGGRVEVIPFLEGYSTSAIERKIKERG